MTIAAVSRDLSSAVSFANTSVREGSFARVVGSKQVAPKESGGSLRAPFSTVEGHTDFQRDDCDERRDNYQNVHESFLAFQTGAGVESPRSVIR